MRYSMTFFTLFFVLGACNTNSLNESAAPARDSLRPVARSSDSGKKSSNVAQSNDDGNPGPDPKDVLAEVIGKYDKVLVIDSTILLGQNTFNIKVTYHCLKDSGIVVPALYLEPYGLKEFVTHNYIADLVVKRNDSALVNRVVSKNDFIKLVDESVQKYGILREPNIEMDKQGRWIGIGYSYSIPLTDVGMAVYQLVNKDGTIEVKDRMPE